MNFSGNYQLNEEDDIVTLLTILTLGKEDTIEDIYSRPNEELEATYEDEVDISFYTDALYKTLKSVYDTMCIYKRENERLELANTYLRSQANAYGIKKLMTYNKVEQSQTLPSYFYDAEFISSQLYEEDSELFSS
jgi:hypothetical protein